MSANTESLFRLGAALLALLFLTFVVVFVREDVAKGWEEWVQVCFFLCLGVAFAKYALRGRR
jgi:hypothetical protein